MRWFIPCISCVLFLTGCTAASVDSAPDPDRRRRAPKTVSSNAALPLLETDEVRARAQVALDIEAQPSDVQRRYYAALIDAFDRSIAVEDEQIANFKQGQHDGLSPADTDHARTRVQEQRSRWSDQRAAAAAALARLEAHK